MIQENTTFSSSTLKANSSTTVIVGMSGGVDSSVTAAILKDAGYKVIGFFMKNWEEKDANGVCTSAQDYQDVVRVCQKLEIPYYSTEFVEEYRDRVFAQFLKEYEAGFTPNPDVLCNREIKFDAFYEKAMELGGDLLATGHYCRTRDGLLLKGLDSTKDQSYFLHAIDGSKLARTLFPVGELEKTEVRKIAARLDLATKNKKDSTGICFIGERNFKPFLAQYLKPKRGSFKSLQGEHVGFHDGAQFYTLGQRRGLGLGGEGDRWFVVDKNIKDNVVYVERGELHPALYTDELWASELTWITKAPVAAGVPLVCKAKTRYRQNDQECVLILDPAGNAHVRFTDPQRAVTPGQSVVFYHNDICLGGGVIRQIGETYFQKGYDLSRFQDQLKSRQISADQYT